MILDLPGLETCVDNQLHSLWPSISLPGEFLGFDILFQQLLVFGLCNIFFEFQEPNPEDPLNKEAAMELQANRRVFEQNVQKTMKGDCLQMIMNYELARVSFHFPRWHP